MGRRLEAVKENNDDDGSSMGSIVGVKPESIWCQLMDSRQIPSPSTENDHYDRTSFQANLQPSTMYQPNGFASAAGPASTSGSSDDGADEPSTIRSFHDSQDGSDTDTNKDSSQTNRKRPSKQLRNMPLAHAEKNNHLVGSIRAVSIPLAAALDETASEENLEVIEQGIKQDAERRSVACCKRHGWYILLGVVVGILAATAVAVAIAFANAGGTLPSPSGVTTANATVPTISPADDTVDKPTYLPTLEEVSPVASPSTSSNVLSSCFESKSELQRAVDSYIEGDHESVKRRYGEIEYWCVSRITDFSGLFQDKRNFNEPLHAWDLSNAVTTESMFENAVLFNQNLTRWNTKSVETMERMFAGATSFDGDISTFVTQNVVSMDSMFLDAAAFTGKDLSLWDTARVQTMNSMFHKTQQFNSNLTSWNTSSVIDMSRMFLGSRSFDGDISTWDTSRVTSMRAMFQGASAFKRDLSKWDTSAVVDMGRMFWLCSGFNGDLSSWDVTSAMDLSMMFRSARAFSIDLCAWRSMLSTEALTDGIFLGSGCPESSDPDLTAKQGSFCFPCN